MPCGDPMLDKFKDECAVFGIAGHHEASNLAYLGLYAMQHRGQESAGIAAADGHRVIVSKDMGYVADIFDSDRLATLTGTSAIGHARYSTAGDSKLNNAQPILIDCVHGQIAIAHNGNLINAQELRDHLVRLGSIFQTSSDTEVILHLYARSRAATIEDAFIESISQIRGAFSLVILTPDRMIAARDPHGFRPLALGKLGDAWVACSETCALDLIGATYVRDVEPGEVVVVGPAGLALDQAVPHRTAGALRVRTRLLRSSRQLRLREERERGAHEPGTRPRARGAGRCRRHRPDPGLGGLCRRRLRRGKRYSDADGSDPQSLRGPNVHPAAAVDSPLRRPREAESGEEHSRGQAGRPRRRLHRSRHDEPQDRPDGEGGRRQGGAHADQLSADHLTLLLRRRYAASLGAHRRHAHARRDSQISRRRDPQLSEPRGHARVRSDRGASRTAPRATPANTRLRSPRTRRPTSSSR